ncbi:UBE3C [Cordylochernes scorpioides]|uniref:HECT-type E3 ubiquitin transferase n=1 Tax=Cordylochernes scorpioides TaxID=51811 RepID=A0ABY6K265_9ARAC|nr:UBE3C [Cordylochernes scorpioides]
MYQIELSLAVDHDLDKAKLLKMSSLYSTVQHKSKLQNQIRISKRNIQLCEWCLTKSAVVAAQGKPTEVRQSESRMYPATRAGSVTPHARTTPAKPADSVQSRSGPSPPGWRFKVACGVLAVAGPSASDPARIPAPTDGSGTLLETPGIQTALPLSGLHGLLSSCPFHQQSSEAAGSADPSLRVSAGARPLPHLVLPHPKGNSLVRGHLSLKDTLAQQLGVLYREDGGSLGPTDAEGALEPPVPALCIPPGGQTARTAAGTRGTASRGLYLQPAPIYISPVFLVGAGGAPLRLEEDRPCCKGERCGVQMSLPPQPGEELAGRCLVLLMEPGLVALCCRMADQEQNTACLAHLCHALMVAFPRIPLPRLAPLASLIFRPRFLRSLWLHIHSLAPPPMPSTLAAPTPVLQKLAQGVCLSPWEKETFLPPLIVFCAFLSHLLPTMYDEELCLETSPLPFSAAELPQVGLVLRDVCLGLVELSYPDIRPLMGHAMKPADVRQWRQLFRCSVSLLQQIYLRDVRHRFCPPEHWISLKVKVPSAAEIDLKDHSPDSESLKHWAQNEKLVDVAICFNIALLSCLNEKLEGKQDQITK